MQNLKGFKRMLKGLFNAFPRSAVRHMDLQGNPFKTFPRSVATELQNSVAGQYCQARTKDTVNGPGVLLWGAEIT